MSSPPLIKTQTGTSTDCQPRGMAPQHRILVLLATVWSLTSLCSRGVPVPPTDSQWLLCQSQGRCGEKIFNPLTHCCYDDAVVARSTQRRCGNCTFRICEEQCCPGLLPFLHTLVVKDRGHSCLVAPKAEDRICHSVR